MGFMTYMSLSLFSTSKVITMGLMGWIRSSVQAGFVSAGQANIAIEAKTAEECELVLKDYLISDRRLSLQWTSN